MASLSAEQLRGALARYREGARHGRFPQNLREQAAAFARGRLRAGATPADIARELGVVEATVRTWVKGAEASAPRAVRSSGELAMVPLVVRPAPEVVARARLEVSFPDGTRLQVVGMAGREVVDAIMALRGAR